MAMYSDCTARTCRRLASRTLCRSSALAARLLRGGSCGSRLPRPLLLHRHTQRQRLRRAGARLACCYGGSGITAPEQVLHAAL